MGYDAIIFDNDGVLTELTEIEILESAIRKTFEEFGVSEPSEEHIRDLIGVERERVETICEKYSIDAHDFWRRRDVNASRVQRRAIKERRKSLYDDVASVLSLEHDMAIVSNNQHRTVECVVDHFGLDGHFEVCYGRKPHIKDIERKKPNPYYLSKAIEELGSTNPLYVGDSNADMEAARRVGVDSAFVRRPHRDGYELETGPTYEVRDLGELAEVV